MGEDKASSQFEKPSEHEIREQPYLKVRIEGKPGAWLFYGLKGHEREYVVHIDGYDWDHYISREFSEKLQEILGKEFYVMNRGSRIEITGKRDDARVQEIIEAALHDNTLAARDEQ